MGERNVEAEIDQAVEEIGVDLDAYERMVDRVDQLIGAAKMVGMSEARIRQLERVKEGFEPFRELVTHMGEQIDPFVSMAQHGYPGEIIAETGWDKSFCRIYAMVEPIA